MPECWSVFAGGWISGLLMGPLLWLCARLRYERVSPGLCLVIQRRGQWRVRHRGCWVGSRTQVHRLAVHAHALEISLRGQDAVWSRDRARIEVVAHVSVAIDPSPLQQIAAVRRLGCERASDGKVIADLIVPHLEEALHAVASTFSAEDVYARRLDFRDRVLEVVSPQLGEYRIDSIAISTFQKIG